MENTVSEKVCFERHKALEEYLGNDKKNLEKHDGEIKDVQEAIVRLTALMEKQDKADCDHEERIRTIESKPAKRWDSLIAQIITIIVAALAGGAIGKII